MKTIHRHIGGLEIIKNTAQWLTIIHRHIGGLEKQAELAAMVA